MRKVVSPAPSWRRFLCLGGWHAAGLRFDRAGTVDRRQQGALPPQRLVPFGCTFVH